jgi:hypothetical protein
MPVINVRTGSITKPNSTAVVPRLSRTSFHISEDPDRDCRCNSVRYGP